MACIRSERKVRRYYPPSILRSRFKMERYYCIKQNILRTDMLSKPPEPGEGLRATAASSQQIPKPKGSAGRPSRGGYQLATVLGWELSQLNALQVSYFDVLMYLVMTLQTGTSQ